jgi:hypothetical protein
MSNTPLRKKILALARQFDGKIITADTAFFLRSTLGSMDDTLTDEEVLMFLTRFAEGKTFDTVISATPPDTSLVKVNVDKAGKVTVSPAPFSRS